MIKAWIYAFFHVYICKHIKKIYNGGRVREKVFSGIDLELAVSETVNECIREGILADVLSRQKAEVIALFLTEFDAEKQKRLDYSEGVEVGKELGKELGEQRVNQLIRILAANGRSDDIVKAAENVEYQKALFEEFGL